MIAAQENLLNNAFTYHKTSRFIYISENIYFFEKNSTMKKKVSV